MKQTLKFLFGAIVVLSAFRSEHALAGAETEVDLELVLAVDISRSMDPAEQELQRAGYVAGMTHPDVLAAIRSGALGRIAVTYVEWAGPSAQTVVAGWSVIDGAETARRFATALSAKPPGNLRGTSISAALAFSATLFADNGYRGMRQVIDVSGDGPNNMGPPVLAIRAEVISQGITINGLPIMLHNDVLSGYSIRELDLYYEDCVIGGPGAFLITLETVETVADAIRRKLVLEIADSTPRLMRTTPVQFSEPEPRIDCLIGEKLRRRWMDP